MATTNLAGNLVRAKLLPLLALPAIEEVVWVTDKPGPPLPRVRYVVPRHGLPHGPLRLFLRLPVLVVTILRERPALVMGYNLNPHGVIVFALGRLLGRRVAINLIGGPDEVEGGGYRVDPHVPRPRPWLQALYLAVLRRTDVVIVVGSRARRYLIAQGVEARRIHLISSKIDPARFRPRPEARPDYDLLIAAALIPLKQVDVFLRIVASLRARFPAIRAAVLGDGPLRGELEALAQSLGLGGCVDFLGFHEDTEAYYVRARVFVLTSIGEGLSLAMMEAMACGVPAVVPAVGDLGDLVRDGETGYLVAPTTPEAFAAVLGPLLADEARRRQLGASARAAVLAGYTIEAGARAWREVFLRTRGQGPGTRDRGHGTKDTGQGARDLGSPR